jgi:hypothetical protein
MVNEGPEDWHGHGTHVAGISIADRDPFIGMAPKASGVMVKVFSRESPGASDGDIMGSAVIARERGVDVVSLSLGSRGSSADNLAEFFSQLTKQKTDSGEYPIVTASAGNSGPFDRTLSQPAAGANVIAVAAAAKSLDDGRPEISFFSSVGPDVDRRYSIRRLRLKPELTALGGDILTAAGNAAIYLFGIFSTKSKDSPRSPSDHEDGKHTGLSGTSMSNPMVAGIALLVKQVMKATGGVTPFVAENLPFVMKAVLMRSSRDLGAPVWFQGAGLVDAWAAVKLVAGAAGKSVGRGLRRLLAQEAPSAPEGWAWVERLKSLHDIEDEVYRSAELAKSEAQARLDEGEPENADLPAEERAALSGAAQGEAQRRFNAARDAALPKVLAALKDDVWLVRHQAASAPPRPRCRWPRRRSTTPTRACAAWPSSRSPRRPGTPWTCCSGTPPRARPGTSAPTPPTPWPAAATAPPSRGRSRSWSRPTRRRASARPGCWASCRRAPPRPRPRRWRGASRTGRSGGTCATWRRRR